MCDVGNTDLIFHVLQLPLNIIWRLKYSYLVLPHADITHIHSFHEKHGRFKLLMLKHVYCTCCPVYAWLSLSV